MAVYGNGFDKIKAKKKVKVDDTIIIDSDKK